MCFLKNSRRFFCISFSNTYSDCPFSWGCRIHQRLLCRGRRCCPSPNECPDMTLKKIDGEAPVMLELLGMGSSSLLPLLPNRRLFRIQLNVRIVLFQTIQFSICTQFSSILPLNRCYHTGPE